MWRILVQIAIYPTGFVDKYAVCDLTYAPATNVPVEAVIKCLLRVHWRGMPAVVAEPGKVQLVAGPGKVEVDKWLARYHEGRGNARKACLRLKKTITESSSGVGAREGLDSELRQEAQAARREAIRVLLKNRAADTHLDSAVWSWLLVRRWDIQFVNGGIVLSSPGPQKLLLNVIQL
jgi:hypothetical protein